MVDHYLPENRGNLLFQGKKGSSADTIEGQKKIFNFYFLMSCLFTVLFVLALTGSNLFAKLALFGILLLFCWVMIFIAAGFEIDGIFEKGITFMSSNLFEKRKGHSFHRYEDITHIYYGIIKTANGESRYLRIVGKNLSDRKRDGDYICENLFLNDYFIRLQKTLEEKCCKAEWIEENEL